MKILLALTLIGLGAQAQAARIIDGYHDKEAGLLHFTIESRQLCTRPMFKLVESSPCAKRSCYYVLDEIPILRMHCGQNYKITTVTLEAPAADQRMDFIFMGDEGGIVDLQR